MTKLRNTMFVRDQNKKIILQGTKIKNTLFIRDWNEASVICYNKQVYLSFVVCETDMVSGWWIEWGGATKSTKRNNFYSILAIPTKQISQGLFLPLYSSNAHSLVSWECAFLWGLCTLLLFPLIFTCYRVHLFTRHG